MHGFPSGRRRASAYASQPRFPVHLPAGDRLAHGRAGHLPADLLRRRNIVTAALRPRDEPTKKTWRWEVGWTAATLLIFVGLAVWGADLYLQLYNPPRERAADLRRRQAVDVEGAAPRRPARDQRAARAAGPGRAAGDGVAGRDPQLLHPGAADQAGRRSRPLRDHVVPRRQGRALSSVLRRILRHRSCAYGRLADGHGAARFADWLQAQGGQQTLAAQGEQLFRRYGCSGCHEPRRHGARAQPQRRVRKPGAAVGRQRRGRRRALCPRFDPRPEGSRSRPATRRSCRPSPGRSARTISPSWSPTSSRSGPAGAGGRH